jgi:hypothetical protein
MGRCVCGTVCRGSFDKLAEVPIIFYLAGMLGKMVGIILGMKIFATGNKLHIANIIMKQ